jgi:hypothetical protein
VLAVVAERSVLLSKFSMSLELLLDKVFCCLCSGKRSVILGEDNTVKFSVGTLLGDASKASNWSKFIFNFFILSASGGCAQICLRNKIDSRN